MQLTTKGQVTIPKKYRDELGLRPGIDVDFVVEKGALKIVKSGGKKSPFDKVTGIVKLNRSVDEAIEEIRGR